MESIGVVVEIAFMWIESVVVLLLFILVFSRIGVRSRHQHHNNHHYHE